MVNSKQHLIAQRQLWIVGMPLNESKAVSDSALLVLNECKVIIGERRKVALRFLKDLSTKTRELFFIDSMQDREKPLLIETLKKLAAGEKVALFSDGGMPILFDPGQEILSLCRQLGYQICVESGATSWSTACVVSSWNPPFFIEGFLPQKKEERRDRLRELNLINAHIVLMDTPYRFERLMDEIKSQLGGQRELFLCWELDNIHQRFFWGNIKQLQMFSKKHGMHKGEFVMILRNQRTRKPRD